MLVTAVLPEAVKLAEPTSPVLAKTVSLAGLRKLGMSVGPEVGYELTKP